MKRGIKGFYIRFIKGVYIRTLSLSTNSNTAKPLAFMPRCCSPIKNEFSPSYASVLVAGDGDSLKTAVSELERGHLRPCITSWCSCCQAPYLITSSMGLFKSPSEHHAHMLTLAKTMKARRNTPEDK